MRRGCFALAGVGIAIAGVLLWCVRSLGRLNWPEPSTFPRLRAERMLEWGGVRAEVRRTLWVDLDVNTIIAETGPVRPDAELLAPAGPGRSRHRPDSGRFGEVRVAPLPGGGSLVGLFAPSTRGEAEQARPRFLREWRAAQER